MKMNIRSVETTDGREEISWSGQGSPFQVVRQQDKEAARILIRDQEGLVLGLVFRVVHPGGATVLEADLLMQLRRLKDGASREEVSEIIMALLSALGKDPREYEEAVAVWAPEGEARVLELLIADITRRMGACARELPIVDVINRRPSQKGPQ